MTTSHMVNSAQFTIKLNVSKICLSNHRCFIILCDSQIWKKKQLHLHYIDEMDGESEHFLPVSLPFPQFGPSATARAPIPLAVAAAAAAAAAVPSGNEIR